MYDLLGVLYPCIFLFFLDGWLYKQINDTSHLGYDMFMFWGAKNLTWLYMLYVYIFCFCFVL